MLVGISLGNAPAWISVCSLSRMTASGTGPADLLSARIFRSQQPGWYAKPATVLAFTVDPMGLKQRGQTAILRAVLSPSDGPTR